MLVVSFCCEKRQFVIIPQRFHDKIIGVFHLKFRRTSLWPPNQIFLGAWPPVIYNAPCIANTASEDDDDADDDDEDEDDDNESAKLIFGRSYSIGNCHKRANDRLCYRVLSSTDDRMMLIRWLQVTGPKGHGSEWSVGRSVAWPDCARELSRAGHCQGAVVYGVGARVVSCNPNTALGTCDPSDQ